MRTPRPHPERDGLPSRGALDDLRIPVQVKLAAAWTSFMFLYVYVDILAFYKPGDAEADGEVVIVGTHYLTSTDFI